MKYEVVRMRCHNGIQLRNTVVTSVDKKKNNVEMEPHVAGVLIHTEDSVELIPYGMIAQATMVEVPEEKKGK